MQRFYNIEFLRFLCALAVAIYHWGISFELMKMDSNETFSHVLNIIYGYGDKAVPVFFVISGLVFANVYLSKTQNETLYNFSIKRLARLYPLHILTLFLILFLQILFLKIYGKFELYTFNDFYHFFLNLTFLLGWMFEYGRSFNSPVWTVGQEIFVYFIFFFLIFYIKKYRIKLVFLVYLIFLFIDKMNYIELNFIKNFIYLNYFIDFIRLFFSGVFIFLIINKIRYPKLLTLLSLLLLAFSFLGSFKLHLFCFSLVLLFVLLDKLNLSEKLKKCFTFLGSLTYSIYLLHTFTFLIFLFFLKLLDKVDLFYSEITFVVYIIFTLFLSIISFKFFENRMNKIIRNRLLSYK